MKKVFTVTALLFCISVINTACKKTYECSCHTASGAHEHVNIEAKEKDAKTTCEAKAVGTYTACSLE